MKKSSKIAVVAGLGAIAGGVAGYMLNSDKGREQRQKAGNVIKEQSEKAKGLASDIAEKAKSTASDITSKAKQVMTSASNKTEQVKENVADGVDQLKAKAERIGTNGHTGISA